MEEKIDFNENESEEKRLEITANIVVAGITGSGKSTLLNAIFGEEKAETGKGRPVTDKMQEYSMSNGLINIWDTVGLELDSLKTKESIKAIKKTIAEKSYSKDKYDRIHAIWYCIHSGSNRFQSAELDFIKELHSDEIQVPFIIVLTQCEAAEEIVDQFEDEIKKELERNNINDIKIIQVLAKEVKPRTGIPIEPFGLDKLVSETLEELPNYIQKSFVAAQRVSKKEKRRECDEIIFDYVDRALDGFWDKIPIIQVISADSRVRKMFMDISRTYNTIIDEEKMTEILCSFNVEGKVLKAVIDVNVGWSALILPFKTEYKVKMDDIFESKKKEGFDVNIDKLSSKSPIYYSPDKRVARLIVFYGYAFLDAMETVWDDLNAEQLKDVQLVCDKLKKAIKTYMRQYVKG